MALTGVKRDHNVPFIGPRARYSIIGSNPNWIIQKMATGETFDGLRPEQTAVGADDLDPDVTAGQVEWAELTKGGLFDLLGNAKQALVIEALENVGGATFEIVAGDGTTVLRLGPTTFPSRIAPGEYLRFTGGAAAARVAVLARIDSVRMI